MKVFCAAVLGIMLVLVPVSSPPPCSGLPKLVTGSAAVPSCCCALSSATVPVPPVADSSKPEPAPTLALAA